jgi:hypothetical protein
MTMKSNIHSDPIDKKTLDTISKNFDEMQEAVSPHITPLLPRERRKLPKMGDKTLAFVEKCYEFSHNNPNFCPGLLDMDKYEADYMAARSLYNAVNKAAQFYTNLVDTQLCAGSEAFQASLVFYNYVKLLASNNVAGAKIVYEELRKRFPRGRRRKRLAEDTAPQTDEVAV